MNEKVLPEKKRIFVIDAHPLFREGIKTIIERDKRFEWAGEAGNAHDGLRWCKSLKPDLVTTDLSLPDGDGFQMTRNIRTHLPDTLVLIISVHCKTDCVAQALQAGATGYLVKDSPPNNVISAIESLFKGDYYVDNAVIIEFAEDLLNSADREDPFQYRASGRLTPREVEVMRLLAEGLPRKEIAEKLYISPKTVENHASKIMSKLSIHNTFELIRCAARLGVVDVDSWKS